MLSVELLQGESRNQLLVVVSWYFLASIPAVSLLVLASMIFVNGLQAEQEGEQGNYYHVVDGFI